MRGFTVIETLVTVTIVALLSGLVITYSRSGGKQIVLLRDQARVINEILRSKSLAIQTFASGEKVCGYGVHFSPDGSFTTFKDLAEDCDSSDKIYSGESESVFVSRLDSNLKFSELEISDILFIPPEPAVALFPERGEGLIVISDKNNVLNVKIKVNDAGQVTPQ